MNVPFLQTATFTGLVSTSQYRTSKQWDEVYTAFSSTSASAVKIFEEVTYSQLSSLKASNLLNIGQSYRITDFELKWWNLGYNDQTIKTSGIIEPLIVTAIATDKISNVAYSSLHPDDIVYYDPDATTSYTWGITGGNPQPIPDIKGWITRRIDRSLNIDIGWDWRYITNNCCKFDISSVPTYNTGTTYSAFNIVKSVAGKLYFSIANSNSNNPLNDSLWWSPYSSFVEGDMYFPTNEIGVGGLLSFSPILSTRVQMPTFTNSFTVTGSPAVINFNTNVSNIKIVSGCNNIIIPTGFTNNNIGGSYNFNLIDTNFSNNFISDNFSENVIDKGMQNNTIERAFTKNVIARPSGSQFTMRFCNIRNGFKNNTIAGTNFQNNTISNNCEDNFFAIDVNNNILDDGFKNNKVLRFTINNEIGSECKNNTLNRFFINNKIENTFTNNIIGGENFTHNTIKNDFSYNTVGTNFEYNSIGNTFSTNTVGNDYTNNIIGNNFETNVIGSNFKSNTIYNYYTNNIVGNNFEDNTIYNNFIFNTVQSFFRNNFIKNNISSINFSGATHVYNAYDKMIFLNQNNEKRLSYNDINDQLIITDPTT